MQITRTIVYHLSGPPEQLQAHHTCFDGPEQLPQALAHASSLRKSGARFVTTATENVEHIGQPGVDAVTDGKLPSGDDYTWVKRRSAS